MPVTVGELRVLFVFAGRRIVFTNRFLLAKSVYNDSQEGSYLHRCRGFGALRPWSSKDPTS